MFVTALSRSDYAGVLGVNKNLQSGVCYNETVLKELVHNFSDKLSHNIVQIKKCTLLIGCFLNVQPVLIKTFLIITDIRAE